jgi:hypothetical protein
MPPESPLKGRLRSYFGKYPNKKVTFQDLVSHLTEFTGPNIYYHLKTLLDDGFILRTGKGVYQANAQYKSPDLIRQEIAEKIKQSPAIIQDGRPFDPKSPPLTAVENPRMIAFLGHAWGSSIVARMKTSGFTQEELEFITGLIKKEYPVSEQMLLSMRNGSR